MNKFLPLSLVFISILLVSCGQKNLDTVIVTPDTPIENKDQSAKVCEPVMKYITCSIEKASGDGKEKLQNAFKELQRRIDNDAPSTVAQYCDNMIQVLTSKADVAFKNGCFIESPYTKTDTPQEVTPPAAATPEPVAETAVVKE